MLISCAGERRGSDGASKQPLKLPQAPFQAPTAFLEASSHIVSNIRNALMHDIQYDLVYNKPLSRTVFFSPLATLYIMWDLFFFFNKLFIFNCFTE